MRKLKRPDGWLIEEYITTGGHLFEGGELKGHDSAADDGEYTGRFCFMFKGNRYTRWYTRATAPKWLLAYYEEATSSATHRED